MDFGSALLLTASIWLLVKFYDKLLPNLDPRLFVLGLIAIGQVDVQLVAHSDWGSKQVVSGLALSNMNVCSLVLVGLALTGLAAGFDFAVKKGIANIGQNQGDASA